MESVGITWHSRHKVCREPSFARRNGCSVPSRAVLTTCLLPSMNPFFWKKTPKTQRKGDLANATSLHLIASHSLGEDWGVMDKSVQLVLLGGLDWACWLHSLCLEGHWVPLQHATLSAVSAVNSLHNNFRLAYFCLKKTFVVTARQLFLQGNQSLWFSSSWFSCRTKEL